MAELRDLLDRFRPAAAPGAPARRGVPADRATERDAELAPIFASLAGAEREAADIRRRAVTAARQRRDDALRRAEGVLGQATVRAEGVRAESATLARTTAERERKRAQQAAHDAAESVRLRADEQLPAYVALAVHQARTALDELGAPEVRP